MSLRRFLTRLIWFCILPLGLLAVYLASTLIHEAQDETDRQAQYLARSVVNSIDHHLNARLGALDMLAMSPLIDQPSRWKDVYEQGQSFRQSFGTHVIFSDLHKRMLFNTRLPFGGALPEMPQAHGAVPGPHAGSTAVAEVSNAFKGPLAKEPVVSLSVPVLRAGKAVYVMATHVETSQFRFRLDEVALPATWSITLLDGEGITMAHRGPKRGAASGEEVSGKSYVVQSLSSPWSVLVFIPQSTYYSPLIDTALALVAAIFAATLAGLVGGQLASRRLGSQLKSLADQPSFETSPSDIAEIAGVRAMLFHSYEQNAESIANRHASEQRFRGVFEQAAVGISLIATDGRLQLANQRLCDLTGYTNLELLAKKFQDFTHPGDHGADLMLMERVVLNEINTYTLEKRYIQKSGAVIWVNLSVSAVRRADGSPEYFIALIEDINDRKRGQEALRQKEAALSNAQRLAGLGNWTWDLQTNTTQWSTEMYRIFGRDPQLAPLGYPEVRVYFPPASWASLSAMVDSCITHGTPYQREMELTLADGSRRWISARGQAQTSADGRILAINGTVQDITERTLDQEKLRVSDLAFKAVSQGVLITDASGLIISSNDAFATITGYGEAEILGKKCNFVQGPLTNPQTINAIRWAVDNGAAFTGEIFNYKKDGHGFWNDLAITPVRDAEGKLTHFIGIIRDITARKLVEAELAHHQSHLERLVDTRTAELVQAREAAEAANHAKSAFLATMSHELRTPLNAVVGLTGLLADSPLSLRQRDYAEKIDLSAQALRALVDDILDFSRIEAGTVELEHAPFSLNAILRATSATMGVGIGSKPIEALFDVDADVPDALVGDALRLQQIFLNLTGNAVKFTETGEVVVSVRCLQKSDAQVTLHIHVRDTGIGIAPDQLEAVFGQFVQAAPSTKRTYGGAGLGLAISQRLAGMMEGEITVRSTLAQGSEFSCTVTLARAPEASTTLRPLEGHPLGLRILVVDDHPLARETMVKSCAGFGWHASAVGSGADGLAELRRSAANGQDYDVLLLDWRMPGMDGVEMLHAACAAPDIGLPLVVLMASITELEHAVAASDDLYLDGLAAKPLTPAGLRESITRAYAGEPQNAEPAPPKARGSLRGMRLLVAEDNAFNQEVIFQVLTRAGAEVVMAHNGQEAVDAVRRPGALFDAVLMDLQMPVLDGYGASRVIREELGLLTLPIIAVTAFVRPEDRDQARRAGMVGFIPKPVDVERLLDVLLSHYKGEWGEPAGAANEAKPLEVLDMATALLAFGGDKAKYHALLQQFIASHGDDAHEAQRRFDANDTEAAKGLVHGLNGMASILKADQLAMLAIATESALWDGDSRTVPDLFQALQNAMGALVESVHNLQ